MSTEKQQLRLIFHVGAGKTGTSSIQQTLRTQQEKLRRAGYWYLGLMLEHAHLKKYDWQKTSASEVFHALDESSAAEQLSVILNSVVDEARREGIHTLVWSNESFFDRNKITHSTLSKLQKTGVNLKIIAYVRRHDVWARSAYVQWGIKHKTYVGPVQSFDSWVVTRYPHFSTPLIALKSAFPDCLSIRNLDGMSDVVDDFLDITGLQEIGLKHLRTNETPSAVELFLRSVFNGQFQDCVLPARFDRCVGKDINYDVSVVDYFDQLMPSERDLELIKEGCLNDRASLDQLLTEQGQSPVDTTKLVMKKIQLDPEALIKSLTQIVMSQAIRLERLEKSVREMRESNGLIDK